MVGMDGWRKTSQAEWCLELEIQKNSKSELWLEDGCFTGFRLFTTSVKFQLKVKRRIRWTFFPQILHTADLAVRAGGETNPQEQKKTAGEDGVHQTQTSRECVEYISVITGLPAWLT